MHLQKDWLNQGRLILLTVITNALQNLFDSAEKSSLLWTKNLYLKEPSFGMEWGVKLQIIWLIANYTAV